MEQSNIIIIRLFLLDAAQYNVHVDVHYADETQNVDFLLQLLLLLLLGITIIMTVYRKKKF